MNKMNENKEVLTGKNRSEADSSEDGIFSGDGFSEEDGTEERMFSGDELSEADGTEEGMFSGDELSEEDNDGDGLVEEGRGRENHPGTVPRVAHISTPPGKDDKNKTSSKWLWIMTAMVLALLMGTGGLFIIRQKKLSLQTIKPLFPTVTVPISPKNEIWLKDFLIPLEPEHLYTCVTFSVAIRSWDNGSTYTSSHEKQWLRGVVYAILVEKVHNEKETPSVETFQKWLLQAVHYALPDTLIDRVDVQNFLVL